MNIVYSGCQYQDEHADHVYKFLNTCMTYSSPGKYVFLSPGECADESISYRSNDPEKFYNEVVEWKQNTNAEIVFIQVAETESCGFLKRLVENNHIKPLYTRSNLFLVNYPENVLDLKRRDIDSQLRYMFCSLMLRPHNHRCYLVDMLAKHDLLKNTYYTWYMHNDSFQYEFWQPEIKQCNTLTAEELDIESNPGLIQRTACPIEYLNHSLLDIVSESNVISFFPTEKTLRPLMLKKPFVVQGCVNYHKHLVETFGFELYDEILNYDFDSIPNHRMRTEMLARSVKDLQQKFLTKQFTLEHAWDLVKDKVERNYNRVIEVLKNAEGTDPEVYDYVELFAETPYELLDPKYRNINL